MIIYSMMRDRETDRPSLVAEKTYKRNYCRWDNPKKIVNNLNKLYKIESLPEEHVWIVGFNTCMEPTALFEVSKGNHNSSITNIRGIMIRLLLANCTTFVMVHNHPSGDVNISKMDLEVMQKLKNASELLELFFADFIVTNGWNCYSANEEGVL